MKDKSSSKIFSNKKFLSSNPYWDSAISWHVGIEEGWRGGKDELVGGVKISDCYKSIDLEISDDKQRVLEKLDNLISELQTFKEKYLITHDKFNSRESKPENRGDGESITGKQSEASIGNPK